MSNSTVVFTLAWILGGFSNGTTGMGAAMLALPITAAFLPPQVLVPVSSALVLIICAVIVWNNRQHIDLSVCWRMILGSIPGSWLGLYILTNVPAETISLAAGIAIIFFVLWRVMPKKSYEPREYKVGQAVAGFGKGLIGTSIAFSGPAIAMYSLFAGWTKEKTFANLNLVCMVSCIISGFFHASAGLFTKELLFYLAIGVPASMIGIIIAAPVSKRINTVLFTKILLVVLFISGVVCLIRGFGF